MAKISRTKTKLENQPIVSGDCQKAINWYVDILAEELSAGHSFDRGLFATNFEKEDAAVLESALAHLESKKIKTTIINGSDIYQQAEQVWERAQAETKYGLAVKGPLSVDLLTAQFIVIANLDTPLGAAQLWYLFHHILYPAALAGKPILISTPLKYEEFVMYGAGCEDLEYAGWKISWEKVVALLNATVMNLYQAKQLQQENLPPMLLPEYRFYRALQERHLHVTPHFVVDKHVLDFAVVDETAKVKLNIEFDFMHRFGLLTKESMPLLSRQGKRDRELINAGWQILRFSAKEMTGSLDDCVTAIDEIHRTGNKKVSVGRFVNLPMLSVSPNLPVADREELAAITHNIGPAAIIGGAGSGKTTCIAQRIVFLLAQGVSPERILIISHSAETVQAIKKASEKIMVGGPLDKINFYSWNDLGLRILKENVLAIKRKLPLKTEAAPLKILQKLVSKFTKEADQTALEIEGFPDELAAAKAIAGFKANLISVSAAKENAKSEREQVIAKVYAAYEEQLQKTNRIDRDDLVSLTAQLLAQDTETRARYENLFEHIIVDEYQDATPACDFLARILAAPNDNIVFVGNPDESIYQGKGAAPKLIVQTPLRFPNAGCYVLKRNWRAHPQITKHAEQFIKQKSGIGDEHGIEFETVTGWAKVQTQAIVGPYQFEDEATQLDWLVKTIDELLRQERKPEEIAIVCHSKAQFTHLESLLIPHGLVMDANVSDGMLPDEETDVLFFLKLIADPDGPKAREYFEHVCHLRVKGVSQKLFATITEVAESFNVSYLKAVEFYAEAAADPVANQLDQLVKRIRSMHRDKLSPYEIITLLKRPQWLGDYYRAIKLPPRVAYEPLKTMEQMHDFARTYKTVDEFLKSYAPLKTTQSQIDGGQASLSLLTIAEAKGREFQIVFVPDLVEGIYPDSTEPNQSDEIRAFYVALTRAREILYLSLPKVSGHKECAPSPFLKMAGFEPKVVGTNKTLATKVTEEKTKEVPKAPAINPEIVAKKEPVISQPVIPKAPAISPEIVAKKEPVISQPVIPKAPAISPEIVAKKEPVISQPVIPKAPAISPEIVAKKEPVISQPVIPKTPAINPEIVAKKEPIISQPVIPKAPAISPEATKKTIPPSKAISKENTPKSANIFPVEEEQKISKALEDFSPPTAKTPKSINEVLKPKDEKVINVEQFPETKETAPLVPPAAAMPQNNANECPSCHMQTDSFARFCGECGAPINRSPIILCQSCGHPLQPGEKFCGECGARQ